MIEMQPELCHNLRTLPVCKLHRTAHVLIHLSLRPNCQVFLGVLAAASPKQLKLHYVHRFPSLQWWISMIPFSFRGGSEPVGTGDAVSLIQRVLSNAHTVHTHTLILHAPSVEFYDSIIRFLRHTFPSPTTQTHINKHFLTHTRTTLPYSAGKMRYSALTNTHTPKKKKRGDASKQLLPFPLRELSLQCWELYKSHWERWHPRWLTHTHQ